MIARERCRKVRASSRGDDNVLRSPALNLASLQVSRHDGEGSDLAVSTGGLLWHDLDDFLVVLDDLVEPGCTPAHVVLVFDSLWEESVQVSKLD